MAVHFTLLFKMETILRALSYFILYAWIFNYVLIFYS